MRFVDSSQNPLNLCTHENIPNVLVLVVREKERERKEAQCVKEHSFDRLVVGDVVIDTQHIS